MAFFTILATLITWVGARVARTPRLADLLPHLHQNAIDATGASSVWVTHGYRHSLVRWLSEKGLQAQAVDTRFEGEQDEVGEAVE